MQIFLSNICSRKCGIIFKRFHVLEKKSQSSIDLSNNISEIRCQLKANEPVSERRERASGYNTDLWLAGWRSQTVSGKSGIYYISNTGSHLKLHIFSNTFSCFLALKLCCRPKTLNIVNSSLDSLFLMKGNSLGYEVTNNRAPKFMKKRGAWLRKMIVFSFSLFVAKT